MWQNESGQVKTGVASGNLVDNGLHARKELLFHKQRKRLHATGYGSLDDLGRFGDEHAFFGFQLVAQLHFRQACVGVKARVVYVWHVDDHDVLSRKGCWLHDTRCSCGKRARGARVYLRKQH